MRSPNVTYHASVRPVGPRDGSLDRVEQPPRKSTGREVTEKAVEAALSAVPIAGGPLALAFGAVMGWAYSRRMEEWLNELADAVDDLQQRLDDLNLDELASNEDFVDAVVHATRAAEGTHQREKVEALRNAVLNVALPGAPATDLIRIFLRYLDEFTPSHLRLLTFLNDPTAAFDAREIPKPDLMMGGRSHLLEQALPEFAGRRDFYDPIASDLERAGLASAGLHVTMTGAGLWQSATTDRGKKFLAFITDPRS